jgi:hypothetical protein
VPRWSVCNILECVESDKGFIVIHCRIVSIMNQSSCLSEVRWQTNLHLIPLQLISYVVAQFETRSFWLALHQESGCCIRATWMPAKRKTVFSRCEHNGARFQCMARSNVKSSDDIVLYLGLLGFCTLFSVLYLKNALESCLHHHTLFIKDQL